MKVRNYEKTSIIYLIVIVLFILEFSGTILLCTIKKYSYTKISGIVSNKNTIVLIIDEKERKILYKNQTAYIENKLKKYKIIENKGKLFSKNKTNYYEIILNIDFSNKYKPNDVIELSIKNNKYHLIKIFNVIWGGD